MLRVLHDKHLSLRAVVFALFLLFIFSRYLQQDVGFPGLHWDFGSHIAIAEDLSRGRFFPEVRSEKISEHSIHRYSPLYHGVWGSHFPLLILQKLEIPFSFSMLLFLDLTAIAILYILLFVIPAGNTLFWGLLGYFSVVLMPVLYLHAELGMYSQIFSLLLLTGAIVALFRNHRVLFGFLCIWSCWSYPDGLIWFLPLSIFWIWKKPWAISLKILTVVPLAGLWFAIALVLARRVHLFGYVESMMLLTWLCLLSVAYWLLRGDKKNRALNHFLFASGLCFILVAFVANIAGVLNQYYVQKLLFPVVFLCPIFVALSSKVSEIRRVFFLMLGMLIATSHWHIWSRGVSSFLRSQSDFSPALEKSLREAVRSTSCRDFLVVNSITQGNPSMRILATNGISGSLQIVSNRVLTPLSSKGYFTVEELADFEFAKTSDVLITKLRKMPPNSCLALDQQAFQRITSKSEDLIVFQDEQLILYRSR